MVAEHARPHAVVDALDIVDVSQLLRHWLCRDETSMSNKEGHDVLLVFHCHHSGGSNECVGRRRWTDHLPVVNACRNAGDGRRDSAVALKNFLALCMRGAAILDARTRR